MTSDPPTTFSLRRKDTHWVITYSAMASPCEILLFSHEASEAGHAASLAFNETIRIERKYSRYRDDNIVHAINHSNGAACELDEETTRLFTYAAQCYELSDGKFDITSGVLRRAWQFKGQEIEPDNKLISELLELVGWDKVEFSGDSIHLQPGMEIDLGGIGKEYAVDLVSDKLHALTRLPLLVNFGGDIRAIGKNPNGEPWKIGIEKPTAAGTAVGLVELIDGAVATSGDAQRYCFVNGKRLGHILDPTTGWPVEDAPRSVTVVAAHCLEAGFLATLSMLQGPDAEEFLKAQGVKYHCIR